ncbi:hypothetical protein HZI73_18540 [Vallitalea pronyensis]|uniref:Uncharacterized protein n=1 Tax=Vallitalea pronyensis TaxID=1348613 RepID=A0A8J8MLQ9_9FIRM|nr:hypothetical protein [Vallitalea pronyensis]QUI24167.1 hypothetical protein HZI73_18540 [Vallitalea pronyensis]
MKKMIKYVISIIVIMLIITTGIFKCDSLSAAAAIENGTVVMDDSFDSSGTYAGLVLDGTGSGSFAITHGQLGITTSGSHTTYGVYNAEETLSGHFYAEINIDRDAHVGLALVKKDTNGQPDTLNFTGITIDSTNGKVHVQLMDRQQGVDNVRDNTGQLSTHSPRYDLELNNQYSMPFTGTAKKLRIYRDDNTGFFHYYFLVSKTIYGEEKTGWMEIAPSKDWNPAGTEYFVCPFVKTDTSSVTAYFDHLRAMKKPKEDRDDTATGFDILRRDYNFSGRTGDALVITFPNTSRKYVFWSEMNYVPAWHIDKHTLFTYEFVESWDDTLKGCFEPMSDRLLRWSNVSIIEDNDVRKVVKWRYVLTNPDYKVLGDNGSDELPIVEEYYTFYPDETGTRRIVFKPKLDASWDKWHELSEYIVIADATTKPMDNIPSNVLSVTNREGTYTYHYNFSDFDDINSDKSKFSSPRSTMENWKQMIIAQHFNSGVDAFSVWSNDATFEPTGSTSPDSTVGVYSGYKASPDISWHNPAYQMSHWPMSKEYYYTDDHKSETTWDAQTSHASTFGVEMWNDDPDGSDTHWDEKYLIDPIDGRKYREWTSLIGVTGHHDYASMRNHTGTWLYPGHIAVNEANSTFSHIDYRRKQLVFDKQLDAVCGFILDPTSKSVTVTNPVIKIRNWGTHPVKLTLNGAVLTHGTDYISAIDSEGSALIWVHRQFSHASTFEITDGVATPTPITVQEENLLTNPGFETDHATQTPTGWTEWQTAHASYTEDNGTARSGNYHLAHYNSNAYEVSTYQTVTGLGNGLYTLEAWVKSSGGQGTCWMSAKNYGGNERTMDITATGTWTKIVLTDIHVSDGQCEVSFYSKANGGNWINVDDVTFYKQP